MFIIHRLFAFHPIRTLMLALLPALALSVASVAQAANVGLSLTEDHTVEAGQTISADTDTNACIGVRNANYTLTNKGTISAASTGTSSAMGDESTGVQAVTATVINSGAISASSTLARSRGVYLNIGSVTNSGSIAATSVSGEVRAVYLYTSGSDLINSGTISAASSSGDVYGVYGVSGAVTNSGSIAATSATGDASGIRIYAGTLTNSGTISAISGSGSAHAIDAREGSSHSGSTVYLLSGTKILAGDVISDATPNKLFVQADTDMDFNLGGTWGTVGKSGSGTWTLNSGTSASVVDLSVSNGVLYLSAGGALTVTNSLAVSGGSLVVAAQGQTTAPLDVSGASSVSGGIAVDVSAAGLNTSSAIVSSSSAVPLTSYNPNFTVSSSYSGGVTSATASFTPQDDGASLGAVASLGAAQAFAGVSQARSLSLLAGGASGQQSAENQTILVAANGSLDGLLAPREEQPVWGMYLQPVYNISSRDGSDSEEGYDSTMLGIEAGIDRQFGDGVLGLMIGTGSADIDFTGSDFVKNDTEDQTFFTLGLYGGYQYGNWTFADTLSLTRADHEYKRNAGLGQTAKADYESWLVQNELLAVYNWHPAEFWTVAPRAGLNLISLSREGFGETGAANTVSYGDLDKFFAEANLGLRVEREFSCQGARITPYVGAGFVHSLGDTDISVDQHLDATSTSAQVTTSTDSNRVSGEFGLTLAKDNASITLGYSGEHGEDTESHSVFGTLRVKF